MKFDEYLAGKKIDPVKFRKAEPAQYADFLSLFEQIHPDSFTQQKLFLINRIRRTYQLVEQTEAKKTSAPKAMRPKIKPLKPKTS